MLRLAIAERLRKMDSLNGIETMPGMGVVVEPKQIDAPDIIKVVVFRSGALIQPVRSTLNSQPSRTGVGATAPARSGIVEFPESAFKADGAAVRVGLIPEVGDNIEIELTPLKLAMLFGNKDRLATSLVRLTSAEVRKRHGEPAPP